MVLARKAGNLLKPESSLPNDLTTVVQSARLIFERRPFLRPLRLSSGTITDITEARAEVTVTIDGKTAAGHGAIYLSDLWAWPDPSRTPAERDAAMRSFASQTAASLSSLVGGDAGHPLEAGLRLHRAVLEAESELPPLARLVSTSALDAALHDAAGQALNRSAFALYETDCPIPSADSQFPNGSACAAVRPLLKQPPADGVAATLVVGKGDDLSELSSWVTERGYTCFKLKVGGVDPNEDAQRVSAVFHWARALGVTVPRLSVDANCAAPDAGTVRRFVDTLSATDADAFAALESIEQPTGRDISVHAFDWYAVAARRPVLIDEGLTDWEDLQTAKTQGWNGMAVKTCRGHSFSLAAAAWAHQNGWLLTMMDLTNPGYAAIQSALFAAHLPGVTNMEMNAAQYTPAANEAWLPRLATLLEPTNGIHKIPSPTPPGLGGNL
jgi:L-alanine-DL-glutamate epimerase-like enolase superfamily enzyme